MELAIAIFIGLWITGSVFLAYLGLKSDYQDVIEKERHAK